MNIHLGESIHYFRLVLPSVTDYFSLVIPTHFLVLFLKRTKFSENMKAMKA